MTLFLAVIQVFMLLLMLMEMGGHGNLHTEQITVTSDSSFFQGNLLHMGASPSHMVLSTRNLKQRGIGHQMA